MKPSHILFSFLFLSFSSVLSPAAICMQQDSQSQAKREVSQTANSTEIEEPVALRTEDMPFLGRPIVGIEFRGNKAFSSEELLSRITHVKFGTRFKSSIRELLQTDLDRLRVFLYVDHGYLQARFLEPKLENTLTGMKFTIPIIEGVAYRAGEIEIVGAKLFSPDEVKEIIGLKKGAIIRGYSDLNIGMEALKKKYRDRGYVQFDVYFAPEFPASALAIDEAIADVQFVIEEGEMYTISKISFTGSGAVDDELLRTKLSIKEGEIYNHTLFEKTLAQFNRMGIFELVKEEDISLETNEKARTVEMTFLLTKKSNNKLNLKIRL
jgi:outer membrane protein insertion porin family